MGFSLRLMLRKVSSIGIGILALAGVAATAQEPPGPGDAHRATLRFSSGAFELVSLAQLSTVLAPTDALAGEPGSTSGFWYELQDSGGQTLYRRIIGDPVRLFFEGPDEADGMSPARLSSRRSHGLGGRPFGEEPAGIKASQRGVVHFRHIASRGPAPEQGRAALDLEVPVPADRDEAIPAERFFTVLIPAAQDGDQLVLFSSPLEPGAQAEPAAEVARFVLQVTAQEGGAQ